ncbi:hypothetical protein VAE122_3040329 [Vibrio aestuarianus]|nr:hypothetical protein VAE122_3040329 [Vibrio aestuarianus]
MWVVMGLISNPLLLIWNDTIAKQVSDSYLLLICEVNDRGSEKGQLSLNKLSLRQGSIYKILSADLRYFLHCYSGILS